MVRRPVQKLNIRVCQTKDIGELGKCDDVKYPIFPRSRVRFIGCMNCLECAGSESFPLPVHTTIHHHAEEDALGIGIKIDGIEERRGKRVKVVIDWGFAVVLPGPEESLLT